MVKHVWWVGVSGNLQGNANIVSQFAGDLTAGSVWGEFSKGTIAPANTSLWDKAVLPAPT